MYYKNARIFCADGQFHYGAFEVTEEGRFGSILPRHVPTDAVDLGGATVIPGLVDIHTHGNSGMDFSDGDYAGLVTMSKYYAQCGVTAFAPTSMTLPYPQLEKAFLTARRFVQNPPSGHARLMGIHMEGPYFSEKKKGAQNSDHLKTPDIEEFLALFNACDGLIRIVDIAPELPGASGFIQQARRYCTVSVAHTEADYSKARQAFLDGATHLTHLYNAMPAIHHRDPGVIPAAAEAAGVTAEIIVDGIHVHPAAVRLAFSMFGADRMVLVSDSLRCCGMPDGEYTLGGQKTYLSCSIAKLADGTIAGSATNLFNCMTKAMEFGIPENAAILAATHNPAKVLGAEDKIGAIATGLHADFLVCSANYDKKDVYIGGVPL